MSLVTSYDDDEIIDLGVMDSHERLVDSTEMHPEALGTDKTPPSDKQAEPGLSAQTGDDLHHLQRIRNPNQLRETPNEQIASPFFHKCALRSSVVKVPLDDKLSEHSLSSQ